MRALYIDDQVEAAAEKVKAYAIEHRETLRQIAERMSVNAPGPLNDPNHILLVPAGYKVVYSIEQQPVGWCQHISISVDRRGAWPHENHVSIILEKLFGIRWNPNPKKPDPTKPDVPIQLWSEDKLQAVNFLFRYQFPAGVPAAPSESSSTAPAP